MQDFINLRGAWNLIANLIILALITCVVLRLNRKTKRTRRVKKEVKR
jgi:hypothetical protein